VLGAPGDLGKDLAESVIQVSQLTAVASPYFHPPQLDSCQRPFQSLSASALAQRKKQA
jgi:hypothetical protein